MATVTYKCSNCGGGLTFDPAIQKYKCEYCLSEFTQEELEAMIPKEGSVSEVPDFDEGDAQTMAEPAPAALLYTCPSCGAEVVTDETTAATFCFYCHNPVLLSGKLEGQYHPDYVLPFSLDKEKAVGIFTDWIGKKRYVPKAFFSEDQIEKMTGVYFPYWVYSCQVDGKLEAEGTKLRVWRAGNMEYTETQKFDVSRSGTIGVKNLSRNALKKADKKLVEGVLPFEMDKLKPFQIGYLSGFVAEKRDMEKQEFVREVEDEVRAFAVSNLQSSISGYNSVSIRNKVANIQNPDWKYALMPVWTLTYRDRTNDKIYYFACNGQSGQICGQLPVDKRRLVWLFAEIFVPLMIVMLVVGYFI